MLIRGLVLFLLSTAALHGFAQAPADSSYSMPAAGVIDYFNSAVDGQSELYNGPAYTLMPPPNKGSYYWGDKNYPTVATIRFDNTWHKNVPVLYDVYHDRMISYMGEDLFVLENEKLSDVFLLDHHFVFLNQPGLTPGFYDELYSKNISVLIKRAKVVNEEVVPPQGTRTVIEDKTILYIKKANKYIAVDSKSDLVGVFADKKKAINQFIRENKIDFRVDKEKAAVAVASYYDQLSK
jgi:hypothetical protein